MKKAFTFAREVRAEAAKITWPDFKSTRGMTIAVFILAMLVSIYLWLVDIVLSGGIRFIIGV